ncbi:uncharacterized protein LOC109708295, partial [Ananas comosus]|uniref:Uncharacterized protein LOC109708295 n=1 Tax=Ananas comosus TaxID=4615 RepID=A0A6P5EWP8_ANACO
MKYIKDGQEHRIDGDIRPFGVHEVRYDDARYFIESEDGVRENVENKRKSPSKAPSKATIPHFGSESESDDEEELLQLIQQFQAKEKPWGEDSCDEEEADAICNDISEVKVIKRTPELSENPLSIIRAPEKHYKALSARVMTNVTNLDTFFVPPKVEVVNGKKEVMEGILFYKSENEKHVDLIELENSDDEAFEDITIPRYFSDKLKSVIHRSGCPTRRSRSDRKRCQKMWDIPQNRIVLPNGRTSHTRGLGFNKNSSRHTYTCNMVTINMESSEEYRPLDFEQLEEGGQATIDELLEVNLGTEEEPRPTYISALLPKDEQSNLKALLLEFVDCFAWTYKEMPGLDHEVAVHKLTISPDVRPVKQAPRRMRVDLEEQIIAETKKLIEAG